MLASLITAFFILIGGFAIIAMLSTRQHYAGAWDDLARQRRAMLDADRAGPVDLNYPGTVTARCYEELGGEEPATAIVYGCFKPKSGSFPLQTGLRAAA